MPPRRTKANGNIAKSSPRCRLLELPPEILFMILEHVFVAPSPMRIGPYGPSHPVQKFRAIPRPSGGGPDFLVTSRESYTHGIRMLYGANTFVFGGDPAYTAGFLRSIGRNARNELRSVDVGLSGSISRLRPGQRHVDDIWAMLRDCEKLETLALDIDNLDYCTDERRRRDASMSNSMFKVRGLKKVEVRSQWMDWIGPKHSREFREAWEERLKQSMMRPRLLTS